MALQTSATPLPGDGVEPDGQDLLGNTGEPGQTGLLPPSEEARALGIACECALELCRRQNAGLGTDLPLLLLRVLATFTQRQLGDGIPVEKIGLTSDELLETMEEAEPIRVPQDRSKFLRQHWSQLRKRLEEEDTIALLAQECGHRYVPRLGQSDTKGGRHRKALRWLEAQPASKVDRETPTQPNLEVSADALRYNVERVPRLPVWARPIERLLLTGWRRQMVIWSFVAGAVGLAGLVLFLVHTLSQGSGAISLLLIVGSAALLVGLWSLLKPLYNLFDKRIIRAPMALLPFDVLHAQLEICRVGHTDERGRPVRQLRLVVYSATCPICNGRVDVVEGGRRFPGRMVGQCFENPREHVFSFDQTSRSGRSLF